MSGLIREVIVADGGSTDGTLQLADAAGARTVPAGQTQGSQLAKGAEAARGDWLLFLRADTALEPGWETEALAFMEASQCDKPCAAVFRLGLEETGAHARRRELLAALRSWLFALPYGDQGLLIPARLYRKLGGFRPLARMEDVDFVRRLGRGRLVHLKARAVIGRERHRSESRRPQRGMGLLFLCTLGIPTPVLARLYG